MLYQSYKDKLEKRKRLFERVWHFRALIILCVLFVLAACAALMGVKGIVYDVVFPKTVEYGTPLTASAKSVFGEARFEYRKEGGEWTEKAPRLAGSYECRAVGDGVFGIARAGEISKFEILPAAAEITVVGNSWIYGDEPVFISKDLKYGDTLIVRDPTIVFSSDDKVIISLDTDRVEVVGENGEDATLSYEFSSEDTEVLEIKRSITVETSSATFAYDGEPHSCGEFDVTSERKLLNGHTFEIIESASRTIAGTQRNDFTSYRIVDGEGEEVTQNYKITISAGYLTITPREISITTASGGFIYDGEPHSVQSYEITSGELVSGHAAEITYGEWMGAGEHNNALSSGAIAVTDGTDDVTGNYRFTVTAGDIVISKRAVLISADGKELVYDGRAQGFDAQDYSASTVEGDDESGLVTGHELQITSPFRATDAGEHANKPTYKIVHGNIDVTANYAFEEELAPLKITPREVTVTFAENAEFIYDGKPQKPEIKSSVGLISGHGIKLTFSDYVDCREYVDCEPLSFEIASGSKVENGNYIVKFEKFSLKINPCPITATTSTASFTYDGKPHSSEEVSFSGLVAGHEISCTPENLPSVVTVADGKVVNEFDFSFDITADGKSVKGNYVLEHTDYGTISITPRELSLVTASSEKDGWEYDGQPHSLGTVTAKNLAEGESLSFTAEDPPSGIDVGSWENEFDFTYSVHGANGETTQNYQSPDITYGTLKIYARKITVKTDGLKKTYDGTAFSAKNFDITSGELVAGQNLTLSYGEFVDAKTYSNAPLDYEITSDGGVVTQNYAIEWNYGSIVIDKRPVEMLFGSDSFTYDGEVHSVRNYEITLGSLGFVAGHTPEISYREWTDAGKYDNLPEGKIKVAFGGADVTENYDLKPTAGTVEILKRKVALVTDSDELVYDGEYHNVPHYTVTEGSFVEGHGLLLAEYPYYKNQGEHENIPSDADIYYYDSVNHTYVNVTKNYDYDKKEDVKYGTISISRRPITISTKDRKWHYDADCHLSIDDLEITYYKDESLPYHIIIPAFNVVTEAGEYKNVCTVSIYEYIENGEEVTDNYDITLICDGTVTILQRVITIKTGSRTWVHDGSPKSDTTFEAPELSYLGGTVTHGYQFESYTSVTEITDTDTEVKSVDNVFYGLKIFDNDSGEDKTRNYAVTYEYGALRIKTPIVVRVYKRSKTYDGKELAIGRGGWVIEKKPPDTSYSAIQIYGLTEYGITDAGNVLIEELRGNILRYVTGRENVPSRIDLVGSEIVLEVKKRPLVIKTASISAVKGDQPLYGNSATEPYWFSVGSLVAGHRFRNIEVTGVLQLDEISTKNTVEYGDIVDKNGMVVTGSYEIEEDLGLLFWDEGENKPTAQVLEALPEKSKFSDF